MSERVIVQIGTDRYEVTADYAEILRGAIEATAWAREHEKPRQP